MPYARLLFVALATSLAFILIATAIPSAQAQHGRGSGGGRGGERQGPPPEAYDICEDKEYGESCSFDSPRGKVTGTCGDPRGEEKLLCVPPRGARSGGAPGGPYLRQHTAVQSGGALQLYPATKAPVTDSISNIYVVGDTRYIEANGISAHKTGAFPNSGNPNRIREQQYTWTIPANPRATRAASRPAMGQIFGVAVNGVPFDPGAAEFYQGKRESGWQYEALSGAVPLGLDQNFAHVQPNGAYHYHGLPTKLMDELDVRPGTHSPIIGWAADGFPIYALYGYADPEDPASDIVEMTTSHELKFGYRPASSADPGGYFDGTFTADYDYKPGLGTLDDCNGRFGKTPDFPDGTYAYFLTKDWPVVPRCFRGTPSEDF